MNEPIIFSDRIECRAWFQAHCLTSDGVWFLFSKSTDLKTVKAGEALEEALCFGWIDGVMKSIDDKTYKKYFSPRRKNSHWSEKNKILVEKLKDQGKMTDFGKIKIKEAKKNGQWDAPKAPSISEEQVMFLSELLKNHEPAYTNFREMSPSVKRTYARGYFDAKTDTGRESRLQWMIDRLTKNLKPM